MNISLGVDPGLSGALAVFSPKLSSRERLVVIDMPICRHDSKNIVNAHEVMEFLKKTKPTRALIEKVNAMPSLPNKDGVRVRMGSQSAFGFGDSTATVRTCVVIAGIQYQPITPATWKRGLGLIGTDKNTSRATAAELFPNHADLFDRVMDDGRAEAALLAWYCSRLPRL